MDNENNGWVTIAAMLGTSTAVLRLAAQPWTDDINTAPVSGARFVARVAELSNLAQKLNDTNLTDQNVVEALDQTDLPIGMGWGGRQRLVE